MALMQRASALSPACPLYQHVISRFQPEAERRGAGTSDLSTTARCISSARGPLPSSALTQVSSTRMTRASTRCNAERAFQAKALAGVVPSCQCWQSDWWGLGVGGFHGSWAWAWGMLAGACPVILCSRETKRARCGSRWWGSPFGR